MRRKIPKNIWIPVFLFLFFLIFDTILYDYLVNNPEYYQLDAYTCETEEFRAMNFGDGTISFGKDFAKQHNVEFSEAITLLMLNSRFKISKKDREDFTYFSYQNLLNNVTKNKKNEFLKLQNSYGKILDDLVYFPIPESTNSEMPFVNYSDTWGYERTYGGDRTHEGTDIMAEVQTRGIYPVISISDGVVEKIGWLEQGGWRIGIRTASGAYLYYAHLFNYAKDFQPGATVKAGDLLGFMGDSGYSKVEGTVGNFEVHLHLGIYLQTDHYEELSVNPYWILRYLEENKLKYSY